MCCKDLWYLEVDKPAAPGRVALVKAGTHSLEVNWQGSPSTQTYILQIQKYDLPPTAGLTPKALPQPSVRPVLLSPKPGQPISSMPKTITPTQVSTPVPRIMTPVVKGKLMFFM